MKTENEKRIQEEREVAFMVDPEARFVSLVKRGANQIPFRIVKEQKPMKVLQSLIVPKGTEKDAIKGILGTELEDVVKFDKEVEKGGLVSYEQIPRASFKEDSVEMVTLNEEKGIVGIQGEMVEKADSLFKEESFDVSRATSTQAIELLNSIEIKTAQNALPAAYVVRDMPGNEDCFWRIAGYDFIYDDPSGWWPIYQANKQKLPQPENPDLMYPGMIMTIPEREGENRRGVWVNGTIQDEAP